MCVRTNSSYSPRRFSRSSASTNRRLSLPVSVLTSLRVYAMVLPSRQRQPPRRPQLVDGRAGRLQGVGYEQ
ncbi:hypothetical protein GCM10020295_53750 [Streptomyces cinereospinus]